MALLPVTLVKTRREEWHYSLGGLNHYTDHTMSAGDVWIAVLW
jgi:hypothetical protein